MDNSEYFVIAAGVLLIAFVLWYFFGKREGMQAKSTASGIQQIKVTVKGGYDPDLIAVKQGKPVRLDFYRDETASCSEQLIISDFGIVRELPAFKTTTIEFMPELVGEYPFVCGMRMLRGKIIVQPA